MSRSRLITPLFKACHDSLLSGKVMHL
uniref:Uncharacterized protein n=1 Tax=Arundo donax TaxID=35708 RepID=A0A0A9A357_ARUDO